MLGNAAASVKNLSSQEGRFFVVGWFFSIVLTGGLEGAAYGFAPLEVLAVSQPASQRASERSPRCRLRDTYPPVLARVAACHISLSLAQLIH